MANSHQFLVKVDWTGNQGSGTSSYRSYSRDHLIHIAGKPSLPGSSDPAFRGDPSRYNPEDMLIAALSACHMLSYLHLCAVNNVVVMSYSDEAEGVLTLDANGGGRITSVTLKPRVTITAESSKEVALSLHLDAQKLCFIANSVSCPVHHKPEIIV